MPRGSSRYERLPTEAAPPGAPLDRLPPHAIVRRLVVAERDSIRAVERVADDVARLAESAAAALARGGRLVYVGAGTSGRLATLDAAECPPTFGVAPGRIVAVMAGGRRALVRAVEGAEDRASEAVRAMHELGIGPRDLVIAVAASGVTPFALAALDEARGRGAGTALVTCAPRPGHARRADVVIGLVVGPEALPGSTRLKGGTATKLCLNAISTTAMVLLGKVHEGLMIDLVPGSAKLRARALRITRQLTGLPAPAAARLLRRAGGRPKVALVMHRLGLGRQAAERRLRRSAGHAGRALKEAP